MKINIRTILTASFLTVSLFFISCLDDNNAIVAYRSETSITSFSLGTLKVKVEGKTQDGTKDSTWYDETDMSQYPFTIDQLQRTIENKDSLPVGTDISKVITSISADNSSGIYYGKISNKETKETKDTLWTSTDSIDFSVYPTDNGLEFKVVALNGVVGKPYYVKVNVHKQVPDSLVWSENETPFAQNFSSGYLTRQKAIYTDGHIYVFGMNGGTPVAEYIAINDNGSTSGTWQKIELPKESDTYSPILWNNIIYFISGNSIYRLNNNQAEQANEYHTDQFKLSKLFAGISADGKEVLYAVDSEGKPVIYANGQWTTEKSAPQFPTTGQRFYSYAQPLSYNTAITRTNIFGNNPSAKSESGFFATRLSNDDAWSAYVFAKTDTFVCPNIEDPTMIYYDKKMYAFGGTITTEGIDAKQKSPFAKLFTSSDNGLTWIPATRYLTFPNTEKLSFAKKYEEGKTKGEGSYSCVVDKNNFIWIIWYNGHLSRGRVNRLGFAPKWN